MGIHNSYREEKSRTNIYHVSLLYSVFFRSLHNFASFGASNYTLSSTQHHMGIAYELQSKPGIRGTHEEADGPWNHDADQLARLERRPVLRVGVQ